MALTKAEHLQWCKDRAIEEMDFYNDPVKGIISLMSDLSKHPETSSITYQALCMGQMLDGNLTRQRVIDFIDGFKFKQEV